MPRSMLSLEVGKSVESRDLHLHIRLNLTKSVYRTIQKWIATCKTYHVLYPPFLMSPPDKAPCLMLDVLEQT